jgi:hypothetical protein
VAGILGKGTKFMVSQSAAHVIVIAFIIIGNAAFFLGEKRQKMRGKPQSNSAERK